MDYLNGWPRETFNSAVCMSSTAPIRVSSPDSVTGSCPVNTPETVTGSPSIETLTGHPVIFGSY